MRKREGEGEREKKRERESEREGRAKGDRESVFRNNFQLYPFAGKASI